MIKDDEMVAVNGKSGASKSIHMHILGCIDDSNERGVFS